MMEFGIKSFFELSHRRTVRRNLGRIVVDDSWEEMREEPIESAVVSYALIPPFETLN